MIRLIHAWLGMAVLGIPLVALAGGELPESDKGAASLKFLKVECHGEYGPLGNKTKVVISGKLELTGLALSENKADPNAIQIAKQWDGKGELRQLDARLARSFPFRDRYRVTAIVETENLLNSTNASCSTASGCSGVVISTATAADFGRITSARTSRNVQLGLKFHF